MKIKESSKVTLYADVDITKGLQIVFKNKENQTAYFNKKAVFSDIMKSKTFSYLRRTGRIKIGITTVQAAKCNYISFINPSFENKLFYAKIINYEYVSNSVTEITYAIDYFQTYMFDVKYDQGMIEREHLLEADYNKSVEDPYRRDVYELNTAENFKISKEMEDEYEFGDSGDIQLPDNKAGIANFPKDPNLGQSSCIVLQIADFDTSSMTDIETAFYSKFDVIINSRGIVARDSHSGIPERPEAVPLKIGRGYGIYEIDDTDLSALNKFGDAIEWLTFHGLQNQVIGAFQIGSEAWDAYLYQGTEYGTKIAYVVPRDYNVHNKKLLRFPYQYIRVYNNEGDCKEYKYEMFTDKVIVEEKKYADAKFMYAALFDGAPMVSLIPINYRRKALNPEERIDCHQIPQIGYTTDAYLAFLASQYNMNIASRTDSLSEDLNSMIDKRAADTARDSDNVPGTDFISGIRNQLSSMGNIVSDITSGNYTGMASNLLNTSANSEREEASIWKSGGNYTYSGYFAPAEAAFVADKYNPGSTNGTLGYYLSDTNNDNRYTPGTYTVVRVKLLDQVLAVFDGYLSGYGYASGRYGTPRVCGYIEGTVEPHFAPYFGKKVTYVKTSNMHVIHTISEVSSSIEDMFNSGCQFLKGEDL